MFSKPWFLTIEMKMQSRRQPLQTRPANLPDCRSPCYVFQYCCSKMSFSSGRELKNRNFDIQNPTWQGDLTNLRTETQKRTQERHQQSTIACFKLLGTTLVAWKLKNKRFLLVFESSFWHHWHNTKRWKQKCAFRLDDIAVLEQNRLQTMIFDSRNENAAKNQKSSQPPGLSAPRAVFFDISVKSGVPVEARVQISKYRFRRLL